tara:strand:+ start:19 stop:378 length:360 start_codon:yes stop_codon:yes gene_type:complete
MATLTKLHAKCDTSRKNLVQKQLVPIEVLQKAALSDGYSAEQVLDMKYSDIEGEIEDIFSRKSKYTTIRTPQFHKNRWMRWARLIRERQERKEAQKRYSVFQRDNLLRNMYLSRQMNML